MGPGKRAGPARVDRTAFRKVVLWRTMRCPACISIVCVVIQQHTFIIATATISRAIRKGNYILVYPLIHSERRL